MLPVTVRCYIDWDANGNFTGTYDEVSAETLNVSTRRGRSSVNDEFSPGTLSLALENSSGRYSAYNSSSPLYGKILPGLPIKVTATHNSITYPIFYGYITDYTEQRSQGSSPVVAINATDGSDILRFGEVKIALCAGKRVDQILTDILDDAGWSASLRDLDQAIESPDYFWAYRRPPLDAMRDAVKQELGGQLWLSADGKVTFRNRYARSSAPLLATITSAQSVGYDVRREQVIDKVQHSLGNLSPETNASVLFTLSPTGRELRPGTTYVYNTIEAETNSAAADITTPQPVGSTVPDVVSTTATASMASSTTHNVAMPATVAVGDLLLVFLSTSGTDQDNTVNTPSGWTALSTAEEANGSAYYLRFSTFYKVARGDEAGGNVNFQTSNVAEGHAHTIRIAAGDYYGEPYAASASVSVDTATPLPPVITPAAGFDSYRSIAAAAVTPGASVTISGYPAGHTDNRLTTADELATCTRSILATSESPETFALSSMLAFPNLNCITQTVLVRASMTDYSANSAADGSGTDKTAQVTIDSFEAFGNGFRVVLNNQDAAPCYLTKFQIRGKAIRSSNDDRTISVSVGSPIITGQVLNDSFSFQNNVDAVTGFATYRAAVLGAFQPRPQVSLMPRTDAEMALVLGADIGSRIRLQNATGQWPTKIDLVAFVEQIALNFSPGVLVSAQWSMYSAEQANGTFFRISGSAGAGKDHSKIAPAAATSGYDRITY